ncbi:Hypothetical protein LUCI_3168 [Lucifera butyrica]|uniref:DUF4264 domain-containing protein n=1 Tax=Lucifera butyrica TaxID=1351585 RepID=A0A498RCV6_9FIRM|nr:DUF4264 family protein [Lucifera butyrica]VBB07903.1 Hypothetical protein LUCI_3168 [Lucifera butyrica]
MSTINDTNQGKLDMIASRTFPSENVLVDVVDFLNKSLKRDGYIFGVSKSGEKMTIVIYETGKIPRD